MAIKYTVTTIKGREKLAKGHAGTDTVTAITEVGFGTGGHNTITAVPTIPTGEEIEVSDEVVKKAITGVTFTAPATITVTGVLDFSEGNGSDISAYGFYDADGDLIVLTHTEPTPKTASIRITETWEEVF